MTSSTHADFPPLPRLPGAWTWHAAFAWTPARSPGAVAMLAHQFSGLPLEDRLTHFLAWSILEQSCVLTGPKPQAGSPKACAWDKAFRGLLPRARKPGWTAPPLWIFCQTDKHAVRRLWYLAVRLDEGTAHARWWVGRGRVLRRPHPSGQKLAHFCREVLQAESRETQVLLQELLTSLPRLHFAWPQAYVLELTSRRDRRTKARKHDLRFTRSETPSVRSARLLSEATRQDAIQFWDQRLRQDSRATNRRALCFDILQHRDLRELFTALRTHDHAELEPHPQASWEELLFALPCDDQRALRAVEQILRDLRSFPQYRQQASELLHLWRKLKLTKESTHDAA